MEVHVRPGSSKTAVGGDHDGALLVRVVEPADSGRATVATLKAVARAVEVPGRSVKLLRGATSRRKLLEIEVGPVDEVRVQSTLERLRSKAHA